jgi:hypothetical protein
MGRRLPSRVVSRTLLVKGPEFDHGIGCDLAGMNARHTYVALTRAAKLVTIIGGGSACERVVCSATRSVRMAATVSLRTWWGSGRGAPPRWRGRGCSSLAVGSVAGDLGDGGSGGRFVDDAFAVGVGGDQCLDGQVVDGSGDAA